MEKVHHELLVFMQLSYLKKSNLDDLSRMYRLYHTISKGLELVADAFRQHVTVEVTVLVQHAEDAAKNKQEQIPIRKIIELHDKYTLKEAFDIFCHKTVGGFSISEQLVTFCDNVLKNSGNEKLSDEAIDETLEKVVNLLVYISDKDLFTKFYRKKLAQQLLFNRSGNDDCERSFLTKLKQQFDGHFTSKIEGMVTDLTLAR